MPRLLLLPIISAKCAVGAEKWTRIARTAKSIDCAGKRWLVDVGVTVLAFDMSDPDKVKLRHNGAATLDFAYGLQKAFNVVVEFASPEKTRLDIRGSLRVWRSSKSERHKGFAELTTITGTTNAP